MKGQTVLITTHYIEEANKASNIAFMIDGTILKQSDPQTLLEEYNCQTLESVFLLLCQQRIQTKRTIKPSELLKNCNNTIDEQSNHLERPKKSGQGENNGLDFTRVKAMLRKNYILSLRKPIILYHFYFTPILALTTLYFAISGDPSNVPMVIYNEDLNPEYSQIIIDSIDKKSIHVKMSGSNETAFESVVNGTNYMSLVFGKNFSDTFEYRIRDVFEITDEELELSQIKLYVDFSNPAIGIFILKYIMDAFNKFLNRMSRVFGENAYRYFHLVQVEQPIYGDFVLKLKDIFGPGLLFCLCHILPLIISAHQLLSDKKNSRLERVLVSGVRPIEIFVAFLTQNMLLIGTQLVMILFIQFFVFGNTQNGSYFDVYLLLFLTGIQGMVIGFFIGIIIKEEVGILVCPDMIYKISDSS